MTPETRTVIQTRTLLDGRVRSLVRTDAGFEVVEEVDGEEECHPCGEDLLTAMQRFSGLAKVEPDPVVQDAAPKAPADRPPRKAKLVPVAAPGPAVPEPVPPYERRFSNRSEGHSKFWHGKLVHLATGGAVVMCQWGRLGTTGQSKDFTFSSPRKAREFLDAKCLEKLGRGYEEVPL